MKLLEISTTQPWDLNHFRGEPQDIIYLLTPEDLKGIPDGTALTSIAGEIKIKGKDNVDDDIRRGYIAFGLRKEQIDPICFVLNKLDRKSWDI